MKYKNTVLKMDSDLFTQRKRVIKMVHEARSVLGMDLPWIKVRIVSYEEANILGVCTYNKDYVTISEKLKDWDDNYLRHVVWHELCHAYFTTRHDESCILMRAVLTKPGTKAELIKALKKHSKIHNKKSTKLEKCLA